MYIIVKFRKRIQYLIKAIRSFQIKRKKVLLVFVGDLVLETLHDKYQYWNKQCNMLFIHTDKNLFMKYRKYVKLKDLYVGDNATNSCGKREFEDGLDYVKANREIIMKQICRHKYSKVLLISTLRYSSACGITSELYAQLHQTQYTPLVLGVKPLKFEGISALSNYKKAFSMMNNVSPEGLITVDPNTALKNLNFVTFIISQLSELIDNEIHRQDVSLPVHRLAR